MPAKTKKFRKTRKMKIRKMFSSSSVAVQSANRALLVNSSKLSPFAQRHTANFRFCQQVSINSTTTCGVWTFRLNSMFQPDYTGATSHQPLFRDVLSGVYSRYRVNYVDYKITVLNNTYLFLLGCLATQDSGYNPALSQFQQMIEKRNTKWIPSLINNEPKVLSGRVYNYRVAGVKKSEYEAERNYSAAVGTNPLLELFLTLFGQDVGSASRNTDVMVELDYNTTYYEPFIQGTN